MLAEAVRAEQVVDGTGDGIYRLDGAGQRDLHAVRQEGDDDGSGEGDKAHGDHGHGYPGRDLGCAIHHRQPTQGDRLEANWQLRGRTAPRPRPTAPQPPARVLRRHSAHEITGQVEISEWAGLYAGFCSGAEAPSTVIYLGDTLPCRSSGLPGDSAGRVIIPCLALLRARFTLRVASPRPRWSLTPPFHPYRTRRCGGLFSVALSRGSLRVGVTHRPALWSPDVPRCGKSRHAAVQPTHSRGRV